MTQISSYYASLGISIDRSALRDVDRYLGSIESKVARFQARISRMAFNVKLNVNMRDLKMQLGGLRSRGIDINLQVSQQSLTAMQNQVRNALNNITVRPNVNTRVRTSGGSTAADHRSRNPTSTKGFSPWHNPMMVGGGVGAFMRYGAFSLPFVAGAFGLNSLANKAATLQNQDLAMDVSVGSLGSPGESAQYKKFLDDLGNRLGRTTESMTPFFAQMLSGAKGTELEPHLQEGFASLMEFGSVMGLGTESMKGAIKAFSQMIGKQQIMAEELRGQAAEHLPPVVRMMAEAVTGGDVKALNKMMEKGELDPNKHLPLLFEAMRRNAQPFMEQYFRTVTFWQGKAQKSQEDWMKRFLGSGGTAAIADFYKTWNQVIRDSIPMAEELGRVFEDIVHYFNAAILAPGEIMDWFAGKEKEGNFMTFLFGPSGSSGFLAELDYTLSQLKSLFNTAFGESLVSIESTRKELEALARIINPIIRGIGDIAFIANATATHGTDGLKYASARVAHRDNVEAALAGSPMSPEAKAQVMTREMNVWDTMNPAPGQPGFMGAAVDQAPLPSLWEATKQSVSDQWQAMWGKNPRNSGPSSVAAADGIQRVEISIKQDPLKVEAVVEARTDAEAIANEIKARIEENDRRVQQSALSLFPMTMQ